MWKNSTKIPSISERFFLSKSVAHLHAKYLVLKCWWWLKCVHQLLKWGLTFFSSPRRTQFSSVRRWSRAAAAAAVGAAATSISNRLVLFSENQSWTLVGSCIQHSFFFSISSSSKLTFFHCPDKKCPLEIRHFCPLKNESEGSVIPFDTSYLMARLSFVLPPPSLSLFFVLSKNFYS